MNVYEDRHGIAARLAHLKTLVQRRAESMVPEDEWNARIGIPPDHRGLDWLSEQFSAHYSKNLPVPTVFPTRTGGVQTEWILGPHSVSLNADLGTKSAEWRNLNFDTGESEERRLDLSDSASWSWLADELRRLVSKGPARTNSFYRLGFMTGQFDVPDDFDRMYEDEIAEMFGVADAPDPASQPRQFSEMNTDSIRSTLRDQMAKGFDLYERRPGIYHLIVPMRHEDGDMVDIYLTASPVGNGHVRICDFGLALMRLSFTFEIDTPERQQIFKDTLINNRVSNDDGNLYVDVPIGSLHEGIMQFAGCILKVCNMRILATD